MAKLASPIVCMREILNPYRHWEENKVLSLTIIGKLTLKLMFIAWKG